MDRYEKICGVTLRSQLSVVAQEIQRQHSQYDRLEKFLKVSLTLAPQTDLWNRSDSIPALLMRSYHYDNFDSVGAGREDGQKGFEEN